MLRADDIRSMVKAFGANGYLKIQARMLGLNEDGSCAKDRNGNTVFHEEVVLENGRKIKTVRPQDFSIRQLFEGLIGPVEDYLDVAHDRLGYVDTTTTMREASRIVQPIQVSSHPVLKPFGHRADTDSRSRPSNTITSSFPIMN